MEGASHHGAFGKENRKEINAHRAHLNYSGIPNSCRCFTTKEHTGKIASVLEAVVQQFVICMSDSLKTC